jgi:Asp-tRNA(Asn)/Glu-tRNA(Gln) amidotransferase A subunit family amidase
MQPSDSEKQSQATLTEATVRGRRAWMVQCLLAGGVVASVQPAEALALALQDPESPSDTPRFTAEMVRAASWMSRVPLTEEQCQQIATDLSRKDASIQALRSTPIEENTPMAAVFQPWYFASASPLSDAMPSSIPLESSQASQRHVPDTAEIELPPIDGLESVAFWSLRQLGAGLRRRLFTSQQLTEMYLNRLKRYDPELHCVVNYHEGALEDARRADEELQSGNDRGPLHGIPWGAKDILAIPGMPTTWGAIDYETRVREPIATVAARMNEAGAVLLAKLSVGTLAWGDEWFREKTRNPWDPTQGSSGSSAGSASAVVAGLVGFAIGSETLGSIVSPCRVCCTTGLRPTFGRVSRFGCMTLGWSMDKIGPIARNAEDCGWIFASMLGPDGLDPTVIDRSFEWPAADWSVAKLRIGLPSKARANERKIADLFSAQGAQILELDFEPDPRISAMCDAISVEAAAMHGPLFASIESDSQIGKWGPSFREAQFCSAIDYVQANRARVDLIRKTEAQLQSVDFLIGDGDLSRMNLTGHPSLVVAFGQQTERERPSTAVLTGKLFSETMLLAAGAWIQRESPPTPKPSRF